jgi:hypothetical protein
LTGQEGREAKTRALQSKRENGQRAAPPPAAAMVLSFGEARANWRSSLDAAAASGPIVARVGLILHFGFFPQRARPSRPRQMRSSNRTKKSADLTKLKSGRCLGPCKVLGLDQTKMFHVKHFCKVFFAGKKP